MMGVVSHARSLAMRCSNPVAPADPQVEDMRHSNLVAPADPQVEDMRDAAIQLLQLILWCKI